MKERRRGYQERGKWEWRGVGVDGEVEQEGWNIKDKGVREGGREMEGDGRMWRQARKGEKGQRGGGEGGGAQTERGGWGEGGRTGKRGVGKLQ